MRGPRAGLAAAALAIATMMAVAAPLTTMASSPSSPSPPSPGAPSPSASAAPSPSPSAGVAGDAEAALTEWVVQSAVSSTTAVLGDYSNAASDPQLGSTAFTQLYFGGPHGIGALTIAIWLAVPLLLGAVIRHLVAGDPMAMLRTLFVQLPLAAVVSFAAITWTGTMLTVTDALSSRLVAGSGLTGIAHWAQHLNPSSLGGGFEVMVLCLITTLAALACAIELVIRAASLFLLVALVPLLAVASLWPGSRGALRRLAEVITVTCVSKLAMGLALVVGATLLTGNSANPLLDLCQGTVLLLAAALTPIGLLSSVGLFESGARSAYAGMGVGRMLHNAQSALPGRGRAGSIADGAAPPMHPVTLSFAPGAAADLRIAGGPEGASHG